MRNFEQAYAIADESGSESAFNRGELFALYELIENLPDDSNLVEIGIQFGRSTTFIGALCKDRAFQFDAYDSWEEDVSYKAERNIRRKIAKYELPINIHCMSSAIGAKKYKRKINLIHIDGAHDYKYVKQDCTLWLPKVAEGGFACFDDYGHDSLPDVYKAVSKYMRENPEWAFIGRYGDKLGVFQKI